MNEKELPSRQEHDTTEAELAAREEAAQASERLRQQHEQDAANSPEKNPNTSEQEARHEALAHAEVANNEKTRDNTEASPEKRTRGKTSTHKKNESYREIMNDTRSQMPKTNRAFSKVIHNRAVEITSEAVGSTLARPNAILTGSVSAFIVVLAVYLVARHYGYPLSGSETLISFAAGWLFGIIFDFFRVMITGKR